ncbi:YwmB family TATA-box binding protein [Bacillus sp. V59.32b]|uniref:YwmB family TATA-box binding protein n=1 Tax=Bacillus sp. V59.32b TaxID=1758642 RepID=UPI000E3DC312|nr:YwmB family TATA-box binding protein [Bacillus sp. V59.32b]RFU64237.1 hypothetical protein D0463_10535 [Bacillus sp. V59.32b]
MKNKMKKFLPYIVFIGFIGFMFGNSTIVAKNKTDIITMTERLQHDRNVEIEEWTVYAREKNTDIRSETDFNKAIEKLSKAFPHFKWEVDKNKGEWKAQAEYKNSGTGLTESIKLMATDNKTEPVSYIIYEVKGQSWEDRHALFFGKTFQNRLTDIFRENPTIFSCIKGVINDNIEKVLRNEIGRLLELFQAREIESIKEDRFISVSAQTSMFEQTLTNEELNLQLALRTDGLGGKTTFVVGTPIVTFEY